MLPFNKNTHFIIILVFILFFIVIYLYYTINDVKQLTNEIKKLSSDSQKNNQDINSLVSTISTLNNELNSLKSRNIFEKCTQNSCTIQNNKNIELQNDNDDSSSVNTEELKQIISENDKTNEELDNIVEELTEIVNDNDDEEDEIEAAKTAEETAETAETDKKMEKKETIDYHKLKYDEIKDLCKSKGISTKGTKDQLIAKLMA